MRSKVKTKMSLKEQLEENDRLFEETGYVFGLGELSRKEEDPTKYWTVKSILSGIMNNAWNLAIKVSTSPLAEAGDCMLMLLTPTGETICASHGIQAHMLCPTFAVRDLIMHDYEEDPGIEPGDIFECNYQKITGVHPPDIYDYIPIFHKDELVGWVAGVVHSLDVGGITATSLNMISPSIFGDGIIVPNEKVGVKGDFKKEYIRRVNALSRLPANYMADRRSNAAGCNLVASRVISDVIGKFGLDYYKDVTKEYIEDCRRTIQTRIRHQLVPGRMRIRECMDVPLKGQGIFPGQDRDFLIMIPLELDITKEGKFKWSLHGASAPLPFGGNSAPAMLKAVSSMPITMALAYDWFNHGALAVQDIETVPNSWSDPYADQPWASTSDSWETLVPTITWFCELWSRAQFSRGYIEEVMARFPAMILAEVEGTNPAGYYIHGAVGDLQTSGAGAHAVRDGDDCAMSLGGGRVDMLASESWELFYPFMYLGRRLAADHCGRGKYRGGIPGNPLYMFINTPTASWSLQHLGTHSKTLDNGGMYGAYPQPSFRINVVQGTKEVEAYIKLGKNIPTYRGDPRKPNETNMPAGSYQIGRTVPQAVPEPISSYGIIDYTSVGGSGFGDPIERDPELVKADLDNERSLPGTARSVYAVEAKYDQKRREWLIDYEATSKLRQKVKEKRKEGGIPFKEFWKEERQRVLKKDMIEPITTMLKESMELSPKYAQEFREFWVLPSDFKFA
ncbi:MAG: hydantoinase B/oxoprolinase family protein [Dehalococcoidia bacterium]